MAQGKRNGKSIHIRASAEIVAYLEELAEIGIHGKTPSEVAKSLIGQGVERLIENRVIAIRPRDSHLT